MDEHVCRGYGHDTTHRCCCDIGRDHSALEHRDRIGIEPRWFDRVPAEAR